MDNINNIDVIMDLISWERSDEAQQKGIDMARDVKCIKAFFQPYIPGEYDFVDGVELSFIPSRSKNVWENCARIICERSDEELVPYMDEMLRWLEDINAPGALLIQKRLLNISSVESLAYCINSMIPALVAVDEESWLRSISVLLGNKKLVEKLSYTTIKVLLKYKS